MNPRLDAYTVAPEALAPYIQVENYLSSCRIHPKLIHIVKLRASQLNGCAYCIEMHTREAKKDGDTPERLLLLSAWRESPAFTAKERVALEWTEALTQLDSVPDEAFSALEEHFSPPEIVDLTIVITMINAWNRIAVGFRFVHPALAGSVA